jgi:hypothetical protein
VAQAVSAAGGDALFLAHLVKQHVKLIPDANGGAPALKIVDSKGTIRIGDAKTNSDMTIEGLVSEFQRDPRYAAGFRASAAGGSGASSRNQMGGNRASAFTIPRSVARDINAYREVKAKAHAAGQLLQIVED